jgi:uncharacterized repeat protein (TIGR03803 family)
VKTDNRNLFILLTLMLGLLILDGQLSAQTYATLHTFAAGSSGPGFDECTNSEGGIPYASLFLSGNTLFGTTYSGGTNGCGTVFALNTNGTGFAVLHTFTGGSDGANPRASLILSGNTLYGTTSAGTTDAVGTVFALNTDGTDFTTLHTFTIANGDGGIPYASLILSSNTLYGTTEVGGDNGFGTAFSLTTDGKVFTDLHPFSNGSDGANPMAALVLSGNTLYGTASSGGTNGIGTIFALNTDGSDFTVVYTFGSSGGASPYAPLILSGTTLYGTANAIFAVDTNGTDYTVLHPLIGDSDGGFPNASLLLFGNTLYGTTVFGGVNGSGTVFSLNTDGTGFTVLHAFTGLSGNPPQTNSDGANSFASLIRNGSTLYGTTRRGGTNGFGTVFSLILPSPQLTITQSGTNVILTWPTNSAAFSLQSALQLTGMFTNIPTATSPYTNPINCEHMLFRLVQ